MLTFTTFRLVHLGVALIAGLLMAGLGAGAVQAQNPFSPVRQVNDRIITNFDVDQRIEFMMLLNVAAADMRAEALTRLTQEAVQRDQARRLNLRVDSDELAEGMAEFAARAEVSTDEFVAALEEAGVARESFEKFVEAGLLWRKVVRSRFPQLIAVTDADVARARDTVAILGTERVQISEIFLPTDPQFAEPVAEIMGLIEAANSIDEFSDLAREFSLAGTREQGGRLPDWIPLDNLPGLLRGPLREARPGQIIGPLDVSPEAIAYFQLRARDSTRDIPPDRVKLSYKRLVLPAADSAETQALVAQIQSEVRLCAELGPFARGLSDGALVEREALVNEIPAADAVLLARLDRNEIATARTDSDQMAVLMLCARQLEFDDAPSDRQLEDIVFDRRLSSVADLRLQELVADAEIRDF